MSISDYIDTKIDDEKIKKKLKTQAQKRAYVTNVSWQSSTLLLSYFFVSESVPVCN